MKLDIKSIPTFYCAFVLYSLTFGADITSVGLVLAPLTQGVSQV